MAHWRAEEQRLPPHQNEAPHASGRERLQQNVNAIARCLAVLREEREYTDTAAFKVLFDPQLLVNGEWGTGKTHLLCDVTQERIDLGKASVLVLAKNFEGAIVSEVFSRFNHTGSVEAIFDQLQELGTNLNERAVVILDGVNEGRRREWRRAISMIRALVTDRSALGLIVTCWS